MSLSFNCPYCQEELTIPPEHSGESLQCHSCWKLISIPAEILARLPQQGTPVSETTTVERDQPDQSDSKNWIPATIFGIPAAFFLLMWTFGVTDFFVGIGAILMFLIGFVHVVNFSDCVKHLFAKENTMWKRFALPTVVGSLLIGSLVWLVGCGNENDARHGSGATSSPPRLTQSQPTKSGQSNSIPNVADFDNVETITKKTSSDPQQPKSGQNNNSQSPIYLRPSFVTRYDVSTMDDLRYAFLLSHLIEGDDPKQWKLLNDAVKELKQFVGDALDATVIAKTITTSMPIKGQPAFKQIDEVVADCAQLLGIEKPSVFIRSDPVPQAYVRGIQEPHILVLTSGLIDLYDGAPEELRFVIGHELGHIKCDHIQMKTVGVGLLLALKKVNEKIFGENQILPTLALGRFLSWCREAEVSADRCGMLCCQDPQVAYNAMARLLHGLRPDLKIVGPKDIDPTLFIKEIREWESRPFVEFLIELKKHSATHPFIPERIAQLKLWHGSGVPKQILARRDSPKGERLVQFQVVLLKGLASKDEVVDVYMRFLNENGTELFRSSTQQQVRDAAWQKFNKAIPIQDGQPIFVEIWNDKFSDSLIGLFVVYPNGQTTRYETQIIWNVHERKSPTIRVGIAKIKLVFDKEK